MSKPRLFTLALSFSALLAVTHLPATANDTIDLPSIGAQNTADIAEEKRIGAAWLKQFRQHVPTAQDAILTEYIEQLLNRLAVHSDVDDKTLSLIIAKSPTLNAFAVPGGVIGINTGLLSYAETEEQLASVLAHEIAHLSQKHYARGVEKQKRQSLATTAALLASILLAASSSGDAGAAALSATQAYAIDQQLRFSRTFEREADRIGMDILVRSGMNPHAFTSMFEQMNRASRFSSKPPEFLLTHPLTQNRISDAINLARKYPEREVVENFNYQLIRARTLWLMEDIPQQAIVRFKNELSGFSGSPDANRYGLALALTADQQYEEADRHLSALIKKYPDNIIINIAYSDVVAGKGDAESAIKRIKQLQQENPDYYPLLAQLSQLYSKQRNFPAAVDILTQLTQQRPEDPSFWYQLAEVSGLNQNISLLNKARAEFFILHANFSNAEQQLNALVKREKSGSELHQYGTQRLSELDHLEKQAKL